MRADRASVITRITALYVDKLASSILEPFGLSLAQYKIIGYLYRKEDGTVTTAELENYFQMSHSTSVGRAFEIEKDLETAGSEIESKFTERLTDEEADEYIRLSRKILDMKDGED